MLPLTFTARIGLLVVLSLTIAWIGSVALFYLSLPHDGRSLRPLPGQVAALAALLEGADAVERPLILRAVTSQSMSARVVPGLHVGVTPRFQRVPRLTARAVNDYLNAVGGRPNSVVVSGMQGRPGILSRFSFVTPAHLELRVGLKTGDTLIVDVRSSPVTSVFGLPVGFVAGLLGTVIGLTALVLMHRETKPLVSLAAAVDSLDLSGSPVVLPEAGSSAPEIRAMIAAFNRLQGRLSMLLRSRMAMLGGISHDVRTFATRLRLRIESIPEGVERERAIADIGDMIRLLDDALLTSRAGAGELSEELVEFDEVIRGEVEDRRAEGRPVDLRIGAAGADVVVLGDRLALRRVVANLIDNALKYGGVAHVTVEAETQLVILTVDDEGSGIPPDQRDAMLEPFVRLEASRNRQTGGAGLGLAVARSLVEAHHGTIAITTAPGSGARLTVRLPVFEA